MKAWFLSSVNILLRHLFILSSFGVLRKYSPPWTFPYCVVLQPGAEIYLRLYCMSWIYTEQPVIQWSMVMVASCRGILCSSLFNNGYNVIRVDNQRLWYFCKRPCSLVFRTLGGGSTRNRYIYTEIMWHSFQPVMSRPIAELTTSMIFICNNFDKCIGPLSHTSISVPSHPWYTMWRSCRGVKTYAQHCIMSAL